MACRAWSFLPASCVGSSGLKKRVTLLWALHLNLHLTSVALEKHGVSSITKGAVPSYLFKTPLAVHYDLVGHTIVRTTGADPKSRCLSLLLAVPPSDLGWVPTWSEAFSQGVAPEPTILISPAAYIAFTQHIQCHY